MSTLLGDGSGRSGDSWTTVFEHAGEIIGTQLVRLTSGTSAGCCKDSTCADSERKGLDESLVESCGPTDTDEVGDAYEISRPSTSLVDLLERARHFQNFVLETLWRTSSLGWRSAQ